MMDTCATEAMEASASPRNPIDATDSSSVSERILLVRVRQRQRQFLGRNAAAVVGHGDAADAAAFQPHLMARAPASIAFSSTSLSTDAAAR